MPLRYESGEEMIELSRRKLDWKELTPYELWISQIIDFFEITLEDKSKIIKSVYPKKSKSK